MEFGQALTFVKDIAHSLVAYVHACAVSSLPISELQGLSTPLAWKLLIRVAGAVPTGISYSGRLELRPAPFLIDAVDPQVVTFDQGQFRLNHQHTLRPGSCVAMVATACLGKWQRHFLLHTPLAIYAGQAT